MMAVLVVLQPSISSVPQAWKVNHLTCQIRHYLVLVQYVEHTRLLSLFELNLAVTPSVITVCAHNVKQTPNSHALHVPLE